MEKWRDRSRRNTSVLPLVFLFCQLPCSFQILVDEFVLYGWQTRLIPAVFHGVLPFSLNTRPQKIPELKRFYVAFQIRRKRQKLSKKNDEIVQSLQILNPEGGYLSTGAQLCGVAKHVI